MVTCSFLLPLLASFLPCVTCSLHSELPGVTYQTHFLTYWILLKICFWKDLALGDRIISSGNMGKADKWLRSEIQVAGDELILKLKGLGLHQRKEWEVRGEIGKTKLEPEIQYKGMELREVGRGAKEKRGEGAKKIMLTFEEGRVPSEDNWTRSWSGGIRSLLIKVILSTPPHYSQVTA